MSYDDYLPDSVEDDGLTEAEMEFLADEESAYEPGYAVPSYGPPAYEPGYAAQPYAPPPGWYAPQQAAPFQAQLPAGTPQAVAAYAAARLSCQATYEQAQAAVREALQAGLLQVAQWVADTWRTQATDCAQTPQSSSMVQMPAALIEQGPMRLAPIIRDAVGPVDQTAATYSRARGASTGSGAAAAQPRAAVTATGRPKAAPARPAPTKPAAPHPATRPIVRPTILSMPKTRR